MLLLRSLPAYAPVRLAWVLLLVLCRAQSPPASTGFQTVRSPANGNITVSFKSPPIGTCTTVFANQKQYTGYVTLPPFTLAPIQQNYTINTFFWFIEARSNSSTAPLTVWINGGPGSSSLVGMFQEVGPCEVVEIDNGKLGTKAREWGWDRVSNLLFIDQPNQVGFSYDQLTNGSLDIQEQAVRIPPESLPEGVAAPMFLNGTFSSGDKTQTTNTTAIAAHAIWHMLQGFLGVFPQYNPGTKPNSTQTGVVGVNLFAESYGGVYGPIFSELWEEQNDARWNGSVPRNGTVDVRLKSLGIISGCIDEAVQARYYPIFSNNNTYGIEALNLVDQQNAANSFLRPDGCKAKIQACRDAATAQDPLAYGNVTTVDDACREAQYVCKRDLVAPYLATGRSLYDITQTGPEVFPPSWYLEYLNQAAVQAAVGAPLNFTWFSPAVGGAFQATGDQERPGTLAALGVLLRRGVRVALVHGDRDFVCNWLGGEAAAYAVASAAGPALTPFFAAGYAEIVTNGSYVGGAVRQAGNLSFARVYDAGHLVPAYQPETAFTVFARVVLGTELSTGAPVDLATYASAGPANATRRNELPPPYAPMCWARAPESCTPEQAAALRRGEGALVNGAWYRDAGEWPGPSPGAAESAGVPGSVPGAMTATGAGAGGALATGVPPTPVAPSQSVPTGYYIATATPHSEAALLLLQRGPGGKGGAVGLGVAAAAVAWLGA